MFDVGFWELTLIAILGLVILGPERLPVAIRTLRGWITGVRKFSDTVKAELTEELRVHELHANLKKAEESNLQNLSPEVAESLKTLREAADSVTEPFKKVNTESTLANTTTKEATKTDIQHLEKAVAQSDEQSVAKTVEQSKDKSSDKPQL